MGEMGLGPIGQIALAVDDVAAATAFYRDRLGMRHLFSAPPALSFFDCGGIRLMLAEAEEGEAAGAQPQGTGSVLYFQVDDIEAMHGALSGRGIDFIEEPRKVAELGETELWLASFRDPSGNLLALMCERAVSAS